MLSKMDPSSKCSWLPFGPALGECIMSIQTTICKGRNNLEMFWLTFTRSVRVDCLHLT
jgi:hypothetical protein